LQKLLADYPDAVTQYRRGKTGLLGWFVGQAMKKTRGKANPAVVNRLVQAHLHQLE
jgi:Asp-tRNA(Asn)/Glu-tRNA(Gln) amidotransferase B subunit